MEPEVALLVYFGCVFVLVVVERLTISRWWNGEHEPVRRAIGILTVLLPAAIPVYFQVGTIELFISIFIGYCIAGAVVLVHEQTQKSTRGRARSLKRRIEHAVAHGKDTLEQRDGVV